MAVRLDMMMMGYEKCVSMSRRIRSSSVALIIYLVARPEGRMRSFEAAIEEEEDTYES